jgi:hypothetical protein
VAPPQPDAEFELPDFNSDDSGNSQFDEWNEAFTADTEAEAVEEVAQWGEEQQVHVDPEHAAILASFNLERLQRLKEEELEYVNDAKFEHAVEISRQWAITEEAGRLLMAAEWQRMVELNAQGQTRPERGVSPVAGDDEGAAPPASSSVVGGHAPPPDARSKGGEAGTFACGNKGEERRRDMPIVPQ